jgi:hypothetical protein
MKASLDFDRAVHCSHPFSADRSFPSTLNGAFQLHAMRLQPNSPADAFHAPWFDAPRNSPYCSCLVAVKPSLTSETKDKENFLDPRET